MRETVASLCEWVLGQGRCTISAAEVCPWKVMQSTLVRFALGRVWAGHRCCAHLSLPPPPKRSVGATRPVRLGDFMGRAPAIPSAHTQVIGQGMGRGRLPVKEGTEGLGALACGVYSVSQGPLHRCPLLALRHTVHLLLGMRSKAITVDLEEDYARR
jgi:hypothetical protein